AVTMALAGGGASGGVDDEAARSGAVCLGFAAGWVLAPHTTACSFSGVASVFGPPNQLPINPAIVVGFCSEAGTSPCLGCGADRGTGALATTGSFVVATGCGLTDASAPAAGGEGSRDSAPGGVGVALATR